MNVVRIVCQVLLVISGLFLILTILMHKGKGGGLSDMFGGGFSSGAASSGVAEKNLNRITVVTTVLWSLVVVILGLLEKLAPIATS